MRAVALLLPVLLLGCRKVPLTHVESFGESAATLADSSEVAFALMNAAGADRAAQALVVFPPTNEEEAANRWRALDQSLDTGLIPPAGLTERQELLGKLASYGSALGELAGADLAAELEEKSAALFETIITLNERVADLAGQDPVLGKGAILGVQKTISLVGGALLEGKRRKSLGELIVATDPVVQAAAKLLATDLAKDGVLATATHAQLTNRIRLVQVHYNVNGKDLSFEQRTELVEQVRALHTGRAAVDDLYENAAAAATAMGAAHTALVAAVNQKSWSSEEFLDALGDFTKFVSRVASVREQLEAVGPELGSGLQSAVTVDRSE